jgi:putative ABC transport system substrate-binding protein
MLPDQTVVTPQTLDHIFFFSLENRLPIITFAEKYLKLGAVLSVSFDPTDMGKQAGELALTILNGTNVSDLAPVQVRKADIQVNRLTAKLLGLDIKDVNNHK